MSDGGLRRYLIRNARWLGAGGLLSFLSCFGQTFFISVFAGEIRGEFGLSHGGWGGIYFIATALSAIVMIWSGVMTDWFRVRILGPVVLLGLAVACLGMALNSWVVLLPVVVFGLRLFGQGMSMHIALVAMARWFQATRGRALAIATLGFAIGEAVLPFGFVKAMTRFDWRDLWIFCAFVCLAGIPILMWLLRRERTPQTLTKGESSTGMNNHHWTRGEAISHTLFWFIVPSILGPSAFMTATFFHQVHLAEVKGWEHLTFVSMFPVYTGLSILTAIATGVALDRWGTARMMPLFQLPIALAFLIFAFGTSVVGLLLAFVLMALTAGANATLPSAFWAEYYGTAHIGSIKALATAVMVLGSAIGPGLTGLLIDAGIGMETQFFWFSAYFLMACLLVWVGISRAQSPPRERRRYT
ncbi:MFS transporter [Ruegeria sp. 2012CJ41-6]|uniref:MFS transporter n=1 Tax=Ruegeria spongiae TaxID=2942209 RepID=A0ABT0Q3N4_9RHOB|nr:MFS transporter [Ruegeria spongiae]MCL6283504.1 MFS transporter [Ruegeria spongiae]